MTNAVNSPDRPENTNETAGVAAGSPTQAEKPTGVPTTSGLVAICLLLLAASTLNYMDRMALNQSAGDIQLFFQLNNQDYGQLEGQFALAFGLGALAFGFIVDRFGVFFLYPMLVLLWSLAGFCTGFAPTFATLLLCRFALGFFEAGNWPCGIVTTKRVFPPESRSLGNGFFQGGTALGAILTPMIVLLCLNWSDPARPTREAIGAIGGGMVAAQLPGGLEAWRWPFAAIGILGGGWVIAWFLFAPRSLRLPVLAANPSPGQANTQDTPWYREVFFNRKYWLLVVMIVSVNTTWHCFRVWQPLFLQRQAGYTFAEMNRFSMVFYIAAEVGSLLVGVLTYRLAKKRGIRAARFIAFAFSAVCVAASLLVGYLPPGKNLEPILLLVAFGALGLFPTYFAFSQEVSTKHQGKVTGSLGCINALYLYQLQPKLGQWVDKTQDYANAIMYAGLPPLACLVLMLLLWPREKK